MATDVPCFPIDAENPTAVLELAQRHNADLVIVGPEAPLAAGVSDALIEAGIPAYGPTLAGARLEASKVYCKDFLAQYQIPTAAYGAFTDADAARKHLEQNPAPAVVKASGLAAGKGVLMCSTQTEALVAVEDMLGEKKFGEAGEEIVIEEWLQGEEASIMVMVSGEDFVCLPVSQDHKRAGEGDTGLNTGGMGAYAPASVVTPEMQALIDETIIRPTLRGFTKEGIDYRGTLYIGLMLTPEGPKVLEFNVRFGDPECQVLLPLCETDPVELLYACATRTLKPAEVKLKDAASIIIVLAAKGYPEAYPKGDVIQFPDTLPDDVHIIHAGTKRLENGDIVTSGGRVLGVVAVAPTLEEAKDKAYAVADQIDWPNKYLRRDIAWREFARLES
jgi:phosphoribosylamine--glycine ligase